MSDERPPPPADAVVHDRRGPGRPTLTVCPDGPLLVRGDVDLVGEDGAIIERERQTVALCRCGRSSIRPMCDGSHKLRRGRQSPSTTDVPDTNAAAGSSPSEAGRADGEASTTAT